MLSDTLGSIGVDDNVAVPLPAQPSGVGVRGGEGGGGEGGILLSVWSFFVFVFCFVLFFYFSPYPSPPPSPAYLVDLNDLPRFVLCVDDCDHCCIFCYV